MIDLHFHSNYSDGKYSVPELVDILKGKNIKYAALTDHDSTRGLSEFLKLSKDAGVNTVTGVEITTDYKNAPDVHLLAYDIDPQNKELQKILKQISEGRVRRAEKTVQILQKAGFYITIQDVKDELKTGESNIGKPHMAFALIKRNREKLKELLGEEPTKDDVIQNLFEIGKPFFVPKEAFTTTDTIMIIKKAGGYAVLAHPTYPISKDQLNNFIADFVEAGLSGMEIYFSKYFSKQEDYDHLRTLSEKYNLFVTAGTDFHNTEYGEIGDIEFFGEDAKNIMEQLPWVK